MGFEILIFETTKILNLNFFFGPKNFFSASPDSKSFQSCSRFMLPFQLSMPEGGKRAVMNFTSKTLKPGFRKESDMKELIAKMA